MDGWHRYGALASAQYQLDRHPSPLAFDKLMLSLVGVSPLTPPAMRVALAVTLATRVAHEHALRRDGGALHAKSAPVVMPADSLDTDGETCGVCGTDLHWSALFCPCRDRLTCLQHTACKCPPSRRKLLQRHSLQQLDDMVDALAELAQEATAADPSLVPPPPATFTPVLLPPPTTDPLCVHTA